MISIDTPSDDDLLAVVAAASYSAMCASRFCVMEIGQPRTAHACAASTLTETSRPASTT